MECCVSNRQDIINPIFSFPLLHHSTTPSLHLYHSITPFFYQVALDELRDDRDDHQLDVPFLSANIRMVEHVLSPQLQPDRKGPKLNNLGNLQPEGDGPGIIIFVCLPVCQDVSRVSDAPAIGQKVGGERLEIHLLRVSSISRTPEGRPVLDKGTN